MNNQIDACYDCETKVYILTPDKLKNFFDDIEAVCRKYNLSISHEDGHGSFIIQKYDQFNIDWLREAAKDY